MTYTNPTQGQRASNERDENVVNETTPGSSVVEQRPNVPENGGSNPSLATKRKRFIWNEPLGDPKCPYMYRTMLDLGPLGSIRFHNWHRGDEARALHDHPSAFITLVLKGSYTDVSWPDWVKMIEEWPSGSRDPCKRYDQLEVSSVRYRPAEWTHTVETNGCWTLCYFWPKKREWGFWHANRRGNGFRWFNHRSWHDWMGQVPCE